MLEVRWAITEAQIVKLDSYKSKILLNNLNDTTNKKAQTRQWVVWDIKSNIPSSSHLVHDTQVQNR